MIRFLRTASPRALAASAAAFLALLVAGPVIAIGSGSNSSTPAPKPLAQALAEASKPRAFEGVTARIAFTNSLFESVDMGQGATPLLGNGTGRLWASSDGKVRVELQSSGGGGDVQLVADGKQAWITMGDGETVYRATWTGKEMPADKKRSEKKLPLTVKSIQTAIKSIAGDVKVSEPVPGNVGGQPSYTVTLTPVDTSGLVAGARVTWAASNGAPLAISVLAKGQSNPALDIRATEATFGPVDSSAFDMQPPAGAKITDINLNDLARKAKADGAKSKRAKPVTGLAAVQAKVGFTINAPSELAGLARSEVVLVGKGSDSAVAITYGTKMNSIVVVQRVAEPKKQPTDESGFQLPTKQIGGVTVMELGTSLGSVAQFSRSGIDYTVMGSVPLETIESAVSGL